MQKIIKLEELIKHLENKIKTDSKWSGVCVFNSNPKGNFQKNTYVISINKEKSVYKNDFRIEVKEQYQNTYGKKYLEIENEIVSFFEKKEEEEGISSRIEIRTSNEEFKNSNFPKHLKEGNLLFSVILNIGPEWKKIQHIKKSIIQSYGDSYYISFNNERYSRNYRVNYDFDKEGSYVVIDMDNNKYIQKIRNMKELLEFEERVKEDNEEIEEIKKQIIKKISKQIKDFYVNDKVSEFFIFNRKYPFYGEKYINGVYTIKVFEKKIQSKFKDKFIQKINDHVDSYLRKNKIKLLLDNGIMDDFSKMFYKLLGKKSNKDQEYVLNKYFQFDYKYDIKKIVEKINNDSYNVLGEFEFNKVVKNFSYIKGIIKVIETDYEQFIITKEKVYVNKK